MKPEPNPLNAEIDPLDYSRWIEREHQRRFGPPIRVWVCEGCNSAVVNYGHHCFRCGPTFMLRPDSWMLGTLRTIEECVAA